MENKEIITQIVHGMEYYLETLAIPSHMEKYDDGMCAWIKPQNGAVGPACVYKLNFGNKTYDEIQDAVQNYRKNGAPKTWILTPLSTPDCLREIMINKGLMDAENPDANDQGMAIPPDQMPCTRRSRPNADASISVKKVRSLQEFRAWCEIANTVLHGFNLLDADLYYPVVEAGKMSCFLGYSGQVPAATSATMNNSGNGTLEFIATLSDYRKKGLGKAVCFAAIEQLIEDGASGISLRAREMGASLYRSLGFKAYFGF